MIGNAKQLVIWLMNAPSDKQFKLTEYRQKRSLSQNAYYWVLVQKLAGKLHMSKTELHNRLLQDYGVIETFGGKAARFLLPDTYKTEEDVLRKKTVHLKATSQTTVLADGIRYRTYVLMKGSHDMNTDEMSKLLDGCVQECKAQDIETLTPKELAIMRREDEADKSGGDTEGSKRIRLGA